VADAAAEQVTTNPFANNGAQNEGIFGATAAAVREKSRAWHTDDKICARGVTLRHRRRSAFARRPTKRTKKSEMIVRPLKPASAYVAPVTQTTLNLCRSASRSHHIVVRPRRNTPFRPSTHAKFVRYNEYFFDALSVGAHSCTPADAAGCALYEEPTGYT
jgi:hypothetical protein